MGAADVASSMLPVRAGLEPTPPFSSRFLKQMLLRASLRNSGDTCEVLHLFQGWQDTPRIGHSKSFASDVIRFLFRRLSHLGTEEFTFLVAQSILKLFAMPVAFL